MSVAEKRPASLFLNTLAQATPKLGAYLLSFASAPVILAGLGLRQFGIWALTGGLAQYGALLDLGVGSALSRYVAAHDDDRTLCGRYMAIGLLTVPAVGVVLMLAAVLGAGPASRAVGGISVAHMRVVMLSSAVLLVSSMTAGVLCAYAVGRRRMLVPNLLITLGALINFIASVGSIALGAGLEAYALANAGAGVVSVLVCVPILFWAEGRPPLARPSRHLFRGLLSFSVKAQLVRLTDLINTQTDKIVIALSIGPAAAGAYELANRAALAVREIGIYATSAVDVELTADLRRHGMERLRARYGRLVSVSSTVGMPVTLLAVATAPLLLRAWLGQAPPDATAVMVALSAAYLSATTTGVSYAVAIAAGEPGLIARVATAAAVLNVALTVALAPVFGIWGVLSGTVAALTLGSFAQVVVVHRRFGLSMTSYFDAVRPPLLVCGGLVVPVGLVCFGVEVHGRLAEGATFLALAVAYLTACAAWAGYTGRLPEAVLVRLPRRRAPTPAHADLDHCEQPESRASVPTAPVARDPADTFTVP